MFQYAEAKTFRTYHYAPNQYNMNYNDNYGNFRRYEVPRYSYPSGNYYYNSKPLIYKHGARRSVSDETYVAGQFSGLKAMENRIFNQTFENEAPQFRANGYVPRQTYDNYNGYRPPIFTGSTGGGWKSMLLGNFRNQFTGMPTGFTPAMDPAYMDYFEAERAMMHNNESNGVRTRYGYRNSNTSTSGRTGVTILD